MMTFDIGSRFVCDGHVGTVLYYGHVPSMEGMWLGVEWDDPNRGKHDGHFNGIQYFVTRHEKSGSFLKPTKADFGVSCLDAIINRYRNKTVPSDDCSKTAASSDLFIIMQDNTVLPVEAVGYDKVGFIQSRLNLLRIVCLRNCRVSRAGPSDELSLAVTNIVELDLSQNLLNSWSEVSKICRQLSHLLVLNVSENRLRLPSESEVAKAYFSQLEVIVMNKMNYNWEEVLCCVAMFPRLLRLYCAFNVIRQLSEPEGDFSIMNYLEYLDLEGNSIDGWNEVNKLGSLKRLKSLNLNATNLDGIQLDEGLKSMFPSLESLCLSNNRIQSWKDIDQLNKLPSLVDLWITNNPVLESDKLETVRQLIIAKIGSLKMLNRSTISTEERRGAELDYLKRNGKNWLNSYPNQSQFLKEHPRYQHLIDVYGAPEESEVVSLPVILKNNLLSLEICCSEMEKSVVKKLPGTMNVQKLRGLVQRLMQKENLVLHCESCKKPGHKTELDNDLRELSFYAEDGDRILVT